MAREINIRPVLNGFVCQIGCQTVVFDDTKHMAKEIERYYKNPEKVEQEYLENALNSHNMTVPQPVCNNVCEPTPMGRTATEACCDIRR